MHNLRSEATTGVEANMPAAPVATNTGLRVRLLRRFTSQGLLLLFLQLFINAAFATDESVLQRVRSSLNIEQIVDYAIAKGGSAKFNVDEPITINIDLNVAGMGRDDVQSWQLELLRAFSTVNAYLDLRINLDADRSIKYSPQVPYDPFYGQNELSSAQIINVFADEQALSLGKTGQIVVHDVDRLRGLPDSEGCYVEYRLSNSLINIVTDRRLNPLGCIYGAVLRSLGLTDPFGGYRQTFLSESLPGFRLNGEMAAAYAIHECRNIQKDGAAYRDCLERVLKNGQ